MPKSTKTGGREKGVKNKKTQQWDDLGDWLVAEGATRYMRCLMESDNENYMKRFEMALEYFKPKLARTQVVGEGGGPVQVELVQYKGGKKKNEKE
jgi:hypothetical protein